MTYRAKKSEVDAKIQEDIYSALEAYGYPVIRPTHAKASRQTMPIDSLIDKVLHYGTSIREAEGLTYVLANHPHAKDEFVSQAIARGIVRQAGYLLDIASLYTDSRYKADLAKTSDALLSHKETGLVPVIYRVNPKLCHEPKPGTLEYKWQISFGLDHSAIKKILAKP